MAAGGRPGGALRGRPGGGREAAGGRPGEGRPGASFMAKPGGTRLAILDFDLGFSWFCMILSAFSDLGARFGFAGAPRSFYKVGVSSAREATF